MEGVDENIAQRCTHLMNAWSAGFTANRPDVVAGANAKIARVRVRVRVRDWPQVRIRDS